MIGYDRHGMGESKVGRGNIAPTTIILPKIGIEYGIALNERDVADLDGFWAELDNVLTIAEKSLVDRYQLIASQSIKAAPFTYNNGAMRGLEKGAKTVESAMKHNTLAIGYIGVAEMCQALFRKCFTESTEVWEFAQSVIKHIYDWTKDASDRHDLNFTCYATPAESLCKTAVQALRNQYGVIEDVTSREYLTNSHHVPVWKEMTAFEKVLFEAPFCKYATAGCITYIELDSSVQNNPEGIEQLLNFMMEHDIPYAALNFPIDTCLDCGFTGEFNDRCTVCDSFNIEQLRRVTGYLTVDYRNFNDGKIAEVLDRVKHGNYAGFKYKEILGL